MQESPQAAAPAAPPPAAPAQPASFSQAFSQALAKHSGSPASATPTPEPKAEEPSAPSAPAAPQPNRQQTVPVAAYTAERQKRQDLHAQVIAAETKLKAVEAELAKLRAQPAPTTAKAQSAEDKWLADLADDPDDRVAKIAKEFEDYRKTQEERWQQIDARHQAQIAEQQDAQLDGLLGELHQRLPKLPKPIVEQMTQALLLAEPEGSERTVEEVLLPLWELHQTLTQSAPSAQPAKSPAQPQQAQPKPPPQVGAPSTPQAPTQQKLQPNNLAAYLSDRMRQMSQ